MKVYLESLGCARNLVDSEVMLGKLSSSGCSVTHEPERAEIIIVNTCSFIKDAIDESIDTILELAKCKQDGNCRLLIVAGCLPERFGKDIVKSIPEVDLFLGTGAFDKIADAVKGYLNNEKCLLPDPDNIIMAEQNTSRMNSSSYLAYIKIAEGCNKHCTYCIIPKLRGKQKSRSVQSILSEAENFISSGIKELILVSQDTTSFGSDIKQAPCLDHLLESLSELSDNIWIRFLYGHPESIDDSIIRTVAAHDNICPYFDIPIQHASNRILKLMGRHYTRDDLVRLFDQIRLLVPEASVRTSVLVGFPGETDNDFDELMDFIEDIRFDHLGVFIYSNFEDLPSHHLPKHVSKRVAQKRYDLLMSRQMDISLENQRKYIGRTFNMLVEEKIENNIYQGRTIFQAPEVDGVTYMNTAKSRIGSFEKIKITDVLEYDLIGHAI